MITLRKVRSSATAALPMEISAQAYCPGYLLRNIVRNCSTTSSELLSENREESVYTLSQAKHTEDGRIMILQCKIDRNGWVNIAPCL
jgi:hypothetical protein